MSEGVMPCQLDWLRLDEQYDENGIQWFLTKCEGFWDSPQPRMDLTERITGHGGYLGPNWMKERIIKLEGRAFQDDGDWAKLRAAQAAVNGICGGSTTAQYPLTFESEIGNITCYVQLDDSTTTQPTNVFTPAFDFTIQLIATDPRKYSENWHTVSGGLPLDGSGTGIDFDSTMHWGDGSGHGLLFGDDTVSGGARLINQGTAPSYPVFSIYGPLENPVLSTQDAQGNGYEMKYNATLAEGEWVDIAPEDPSVMLEGSGQRRHLLNPANFSGFVVPAATATAPGELIVGLSHDGDPFGTGHFEASYRDCWW